jgi:hypothetical protein
MISLKNKLLNHSKSQLQLSTPQLNQQQQSHQFKFAQKLDESLANNYSNIKELDNLHKKFDLFVSVAATSTNNSGKPPLCKQSTTMTHNNQLNNKMSMSSISLSISPELSEVSGTSSSHDQVIAANNGSNKENMQQSSKQCQSQPLSSLTSLSCKQPTKFQEKQAQLQHSSSQQQSNAKQSSHLNVENASTPVVVKYGELIVLGLEQLKRKFFFRFITNFFSILYTII